MNISKGKILFAGCEYYNTWYISRELRKLGWKADLLNWDGNVNNWHHYHGWDYLFKFGNEKDHLKQIDFYLKAIEEYDIFHFSNIRGMTFGGIVNQFMKNGSPLHEIEFLKSKGKRIVYSNNGCIDGVSQTSFSQWGPHNTCDICVWQDKPEECSDEANLKWGKFRNEMADYQCTIGGNRKDYNDDPRVHEVPEFYCLDPNVWMPDLDIPDKYRLEKNNHVKIFHTIQNKESRTRNDGKDIKCSHIYKPLFKELISEGYKIEDISITGLKNKDVRYLQGQCDIIVDMLTFGFFGANIREAMMLGKTCVCFLRPEWLKSMRKEIPEYVDELPVISATPETIKQVLIELIEDPDRRRELGKKGRAFALKWHSAKAGAKRMNKIYSDLLGIN